MIRQNWDEQSGTKIALLVLAIVAVFLLFTVLASTYLNPLGSSANDSDEYFYMSSALDILSHHICSPYNVTSSNYTSYVTSRLCNLEHPPMMKELVAVSILELGQNKLGVRLPSMLLGASTIPLVAFLAWKLSNKNGKVTVLSAILMAFNPLLSGLSSVGLLDTGEMFFFLCGFALYFSDLMKQRPGQKFVLVGVLFGLSTLSKEVGILPFLAFATIHLVSHRNASSLKEVAFSTVGLALTVIIGFQTYDSIFTSFPSFLDHIWYLIAYASNIRGYYVSEPPSTWLINLSSSDLSSGLGVTSVLLSVPLLVWVPMMFANLVRKKMSEYVFPFVLFLWTYVPYFVIWYLGRDEKAFYAIQMSPALAIGAAFSFTFFQRKMLPGKPQVILVVCFTAFFIYLYYFLS